MFRDFAQFERSACYSSRYPWWTGCVAGFTISTTRRRVRWLLYTCHRLQKKYYLLNNLFFNKFSGAKGRKPVVEPPQTAERAFTVGQRLGQSFNQGLNQGMNLAQNALGNLFGGFGGDSGAQPRLKVSAGKPSLKPSPLYFKGGN